MDRDGKLEVTICSDRKMQKCCNSNSLPSVFRPNRDYTFCANKIGECYDFKLLHITHFELKQYDFGKNTGWNGKNVEIGFHNNSKLSCGLRKFGVMMDTSVILKETCKLHTPLNPKNTC